MVGGLQHNQTDGKGRGRVPPCAGAEPVVARAGIAPAMNGPRAPSTFTSSAETKLRGQYPPKPVPHDRAPFQDGDGVWKVPLTKGFFALIDQEDAELVGGKLWKAELGGVAGRIPYAVRLETVNGKRVRVYLHRLVASTPDGFLCDHINRNPLDCRRENLRNADHSQNTANARVKLSATGFIGVHRTKSGFEASCQHRGQIYSEAGFESPIEAARVYDDLARELHGEFAKLNFPELP